MKTKLGFLSFVARALLGASALALVHVAGALPAFPGAEGAGANALGGRGGDVYYVTTLADSGPGSLRNGISSATGPRTVLFKVSGNIFLMSDLNINKSFLTIAGQTAPGDGITLQGRQVAVDHCHDVVVRFIRARPGDLYCPEFQGDAFHFLRATNCIADHVSASWSIDEVLSCTESDWITVQWCLITEALNDSCHVKGEHGYGSLLRYGTGAITFHHNLYADHKDRNPLLGDGLKLDFVNNVIYNWGHIAGHNIEEDSSTNILNHSGNYLVAGPSTTSHLTVAFESGVTNANQCEIYQSGNFIDSNQNGFLDGRDMGWAMFGGSFIQRTNRYALPPATTDVAPIGYERVLAFAGAAVARDAVDRRVVNDVVVQTGSIINSQDEVGGFPTLNSAPAPSDADGDGIPDDWEAAVGWDPAIPNNNHLNPDGYTDLEHYLDWLAGPHAVCERDGSVDVDLQECTGGLTNLTYVVADATNGTVTLLPDGHTARFTTASNHVGLAGFQYNPTRLGYRVGFGWVSVRIRVAATNSTVIAPTVNIIEPTNGAVLTGGVAVELTAEVNQGSGPVTNVHFYAGTDGSLAELGEDNTPPYTFQWIPPLAGGAGTIRVVAQDANGVSTVDSIAVTVADPTFTTLSTAVGDGADIEMVEQNDPTAARIDSSTLNTRWNQSNRNEVVGLRFDLSGYALSALGNVKLNVINYRTNSPRYVDIYGVTQGAAGGTGMYDTETWTDTGGGAVQAWGDLPGLLLTDGTDTTLSIDTNHLTLLVDEFPTASLNEGTVETAASPALTSFVQNYTGSSLITLLMTQGDGHPSTGQFRFTSKEATQTDTGVRTGGPGELAPYLSFTFHAVAPRLEYTMTSGGKGIQFWWANGFRLQFQTNSSNGGLGTDWRDYPDTNNPVNIPIDSAGPVTFFRLAP